MRFIHKHFFKLALFLITPIYTVATFVVFFVAPFSIMAFDSPNADVLVLPWIMLLSIYGLAFSLAIATILLIVASLKKKRKLLLISLLLPAPFILVLILIFTISPIF